ncbi:DUF3786 domain-containing protein [Desulfobacterales bacterium HSG17]|nr:DUF3786 domain-containing protein [Desulfobacterales bacterium HSG17]
MSDNYAKLVQNNLKELYENRSNEELAQCLPGTLDRDNVVFEAFGNTCRISSDSIILGNEKQEGIIGILISLYALHSGTDSCIETPFKAFKDFPNSAPYAGAFATHTQNTLIDHVEKIEDNMNRIKTKLKGHDAPADISGDFAFVVWPLPKIALCYIFYEADEDFPASVTCLYSNNAIDFIPIDGLADIGEYTSKEIVGIIF